jgi:flagellar L-ring protein precursor FlgH
VLQHAGGSLARVELAAPSDPAMAGASSLSYYSVPTPQPKLLKKHDLVSILVRESSDFSSEGTTDLKHTQDLDAQIDSYVTMHLQQMRLIEMTPSTPMELKTSAARDFNGTATVNRQDSFNAQISAEVIDVKPNGTLVLRASEAIKTDEEEQTMTLLGTCRVEDISADNTVLSTQLFDLSLNKTHRGAVRDTTERGFITRLLDSINPF